MRKPFKWIVTEAAEYGVTVEAIVAGHIEFRGGKTFMAMSRIGGSQPYWLGFSGDARFPEKKRGTKAEVADWCLDKAVDGF